MVRLARLLTGSVAIAEDLTHDAFVRVAPRLDSLDRPAAYLRTTVVNACRSHHRHEAVVDRLTPTPTTETAPAVAQLVEFEDALARLPRAAAGRHRAALLRRPRRRRHRRAARVPATHVRTLVRRGMAALRGVIER